VSQFVIALEFELARYPDVRDFSCNRDRGSWAADRISRRWVIYVGVTLWSVAATASGLARSFVPLLLSRIFVGVGEASLTPAAYSLMGEKFPRRRLTTAMSIYQMGSQVGTAAAFAVGGVVIGFATSLHGIDWPLVGKLNAWQLSLVMTGSPGIVLALLVFTFTEPRRTEPANPPSGGKRKNIFAYLVSERQLLLPMTCGFVLIVLLVNSLLAWVPTYITREFGLTPAEYGPALGIITLVSGGTMVVKGWIVDWLYSRGMRDAHMRFFCWLVAAATPMAVGAFFVSNSLLFLVLFAIVQVMIAQFVVYVAATVQLVAPKELRAQMVAYFISVFSLVGLGLGPVIAAALTDHVFKDEAMLGYSLAVMSAISLPIAWFSLRLALGRVQPAIDRQDRMSAA
jgi:MFS family permease